MNNLSEKVKMCLKFVGVQDDNIKEFDEIGIMSINIITARDAVWELMKHGIVFKCEPINNEVKISLI